MTNPHTPRARAGREPEPDQLRLLGKVARMYYERGIRQPQIAAELSLSQPRVSRLLRQATEVGIVRTVVTMPPGTYTELEDAIQERYGMRDVVVVDASGAGDAVLPALGAATADYLDVTLTGGHVIGVSSWSESLIAAVDVMRPKNITVVDKVVQIVGGLGDPAVQMQATRLTGRLADLTGGTPVFLSAPGLVGSPAIRKALMRDPSVKEVTELWSRLTVALVGIGSLEPSPLLQRSGNALAETEQEELRSLGAVGDVCFRYFDADGKSVSSNLDQRLIGITPRELMQIPRRIGVAGGSRKFSAIRAALRGGWVNVLITDLEMARRLVAED
ncbi:DNA-binding transcriptional regulator LsrR, DeoR family [Nakamurella panacisegetis]|uniref:DNA-binding transcriptional regulator LsrR, DeoR family n=1 Tax=Nakamurella panacisegetis TaxID=1090615 RepID=A0A1H0NEF4_9ACTN|nr:sugar-binding transcriptional regulator [Nakamurella panacisegetis]SDO91139.1 DNA-binding transcriptional regulator LsrR, DeoR family [Nakamurella panacisegetis]